VRGVTGFGPADLSLPPTQSVTLIDESDAVTPASPERGPR